MRIEVHRSAIFDLDEIVDYIARDDPVRAERFAHEIVARFETIRERPHSFPARADLGDAIRSCTHGRYLIFLQAGETLVEIVRVLHGARDVENLF